MILFSGCDQEKISLFMKLFWKEQQKYLNVSNSSIIRYHPMIIRFCLNRVAKSSSAYSNLRYNSKDGTGILVLLSLQALRDYKNYIKSQRGFNSQIIDDLNKKIVNFTPEEKFIGLQLDGMKILKDLVWDKHTGELIGFVDLGDIDVNFSTLSSPCALASHILVME